MQPLTLSLVQTPTHWHAPARNRALFEDLLDQVPNESQLVLLPEMFSTGFTMASEEVSETMQGETLSWLTQQAVSHGKVLCASLVINESGHYFNRFVAAKPDGAITTYDKRHRFRMAGEHEHYQAGGSKVVFDVAGWRVCPMVCYDLRFPVWFRNAQEYDLLICVANWPKARAAAWHTLLRARAIENQVYCAGVNIVGTDGNQVEYGGGSSVYAADGEVLVEADARAQIITQELSVDALVELRDVFPVWQDADQFQLDR